MSPLQYGNSGYVSGEIVNIILEKKYIKKNKKS